MHHNVVQIFHVITDKEDGLNLCILYKYNPNFHINCCSIFCNVPNLNNSHHLINVEDSRTLAAQCSGNPNLFYPGRKRTSQLLRRFANKTKKCTHIFIIQLLLRSRNDKSPSDQRPDGMRSTIVRGIHYASEVECSNDDLIFFLFG